MKQILLFLAIQLIVVSAFSQTEISEGEIQTTTWTTSGSPYNINGNITIPSDNTLTVESGVEVVFKGEYSLTVIGILIAQGTENNPVSFTADTYWSGIYVPATNLSADSIILDYCNISNSQSGGIRVYSFNKIRISNCHINNSKSSGNGGGIYLEKSNAVIRNNLIENNSAENGGGIYSKSGNPIITGNIFKSNSADGTGGGGGLDLRYAKTTVANNLFIGNSGGIRGGAIYSVYNTNSYQVLYINNTIVNNTSASGGGIYSWKSADKYVNNAIWGNSGGQFAYTSNSPVLHHNAIEGGYSLNYDGLELSSTNNDSDGPMFTTPENNDFTLQASSPLIDAGTPRGTTIGYTENAPETYYTITSRFNNTNAGAVWPKYEFVVPGDSVVFSIEANEHYEFDRATYNDVDVNSELDTDGDTISYTAKNISQNGAFAVVFSQVLYNVTASAGANGSITPSDSTGGIESSLEYTIQPDPGYITDTFTINGVDHLDELVKSGTSYSYVLDTITEDKSLEVGFIYGSFTISTNVNEGGSVSPLEDSVVQYHDETVYTMVPDQYYTLSEVLVNNESVTFDAVGGNYQVTVDSVVTDTELEIIFEPFQYMITKTPVEGGFIYPSDTSYVTFFDSTVFSIIPEPGYLFDSLYLDGIDITHFVTEENGNFSVGLDSISEHKNLKPVFMLDTFTVSVMAPLDGTITPDVDSAVTLKDTIIYSITPNEDYAIDSLLINDIDYSSNLVNKGDYFTFELTEVTEDVTIKVVFGLKTCIISTNASSGGTITPLNGTEVLIYDSAAFEITPNLGYLVSEATLDDKDIKSLIPDDGGTYTIDSVLKDMTLSVSFVPDTFTVTPTYSGCGTISPTQSYTTTINDNTVFELYPNETCNFQILLNDDDITSSVDSYEDGTLYIEVSSVTEDINIEFIFSETTSIDNAKQNRFNIYPNPCHDNLNIDFKDNTKSFNLNVVNILGESVITIDSFNGTTLDVSSLSNGIYYLIINRDGEKHINKFIKK